MKLTKLITSGVLSLACVSAASAGRIKPDVNPPVVIKITGSTAFRGATMQAIGNILVSTPPFQVAYQATSAATVGPGVPAPYSKATSVIFKGTIANSSTNLPAGTAVEIKCYWTGSVGGVLTVDGQVTPPFYGTTGTGKGGWIADSVTTASATTTSGGQIYTSLTASGFALDAASTADATMSDTFQTTTAYNTKSLTDQVVGVVTFAWAKGAGCPSTIDNMTTALAFNLIGGGMPLSQLTANTADGGASVFCIGRDEDSGTRYAAFAESNYGVFGSPQQYQTTGSPITAYQLYPGQTINGVFYSAGHSGYASGGNVITVLNTPISGATGAGTPTASNSLSTFFLGYAGILDLAGLNATGSGVLPYNGVTYSDTNVKEGKYSFWEYEHMLYLPTGFTGAPKALADQIAANIHSTTADTSGVIVSQMEYGKGFEGGAITFGNPYP